jgi:hypothetical protein
MAAPVASASDKTPVDGFLIPAFGGGNANFKEGNVMKNFSRLFGVIVLAGVIALGLVFTSCANTTEYSVIFTNASSYEINVSCPGANPASFKLAESGSGKPPSEQTVTKIGKVSYTWSAVGLTEANKNNYVKVDDTGDGILFRGN